MYRYFIRLSYLGTNYNGWQKQPQPQSKTVQQTIEEALYTFLRFPVDLTGCGRTDTGVHAKDYIAHFDAPTKLEVDEVKYKTNKILPSDIAVHEVFLVHPVAHARFDALSRSYEYNFHIEKNPMIQQSFYYNYGSPEINKLNEAAQLLLNYTDFYTFCKENTDVKTTFCQLTECYWTESSGQYKLRISADRFLRGMIRLIVGMCLDVSRNHLNLEEVKSALENRMKLEKHWSVPAEGLTLCDIKYNFAKIKKPNSDLT